MRKSLQSPELARDRPRQFVIGEIEDAKILETTKFRRNRAGKYVAGEREAPQILQIPEFGRNRARQFVVIELECSMAASCTVRPASSSRKSIVGVIVIVAGTGGLTDRVATPAAERQPRQRQHTRKAVPGCSSDGLHGATSLFARTRPSPHDSAK